MDRVRQGTASLTPEQLAQGAGETLDRAREAGSKGWDALKQRLGNGTQETTTQTGPP